MKIWQVQEADSWSPFLVSISVYFWEFINEIKSVEAVDVFAFFEWASDFENGRWIIDEGLVENVFGSNKTFSFGQLAWPTVWSTAKAAPRFTMKSICERGEDDFKVHFWVSFLRVWRWLFEWALGGYIWRLLRSRGQNPRDGAWGGGLGRWELIDNKRAGLKRLRVVYL